jgi:hypothetical protein
MSGGLGTQPTATTLDVEHLARLAWEGSIRIPHFQRPLRWQRDDVIKLFDSIVRGYPVGSLLLWRRPAPAETVQLGALRINAPQLSDARWVVDGQQRITALANALHPDGQSDDRFWSTDHPEAAEYVDEVNAVTQTIRQFQIPAYVVDQEDPEVLDDIFDRLNSYGKRLTRAEILSALFAGQERDKDDTASSARRHGPSSTSPRKTATPPTFAVRRRFAAPCCSCRRSLASRISRCCPTNTCWWC